MDAVAAGLGSEIDDRHAHAGGRRVENLVAVGETDRHRVDQDVAVIAAVEVGLAADGRHAERVAVAADAGHHARDQMTGLGMFGRAKAQRIFVATTGSDAYFGLGSILEYTTSGEPVGSGTLVSLGSDHYLGGIAVVPESVPEPGAWMLTAGGFGLLVGMKRFKTGSRALIRMRKGGPGRGQKRKRAEWREWAGWGRDLKTPRTSGSSGRNQPLGQSGLKFRA